jgi:predicted dehydrogenase
MAYRGRVPESGAMSTSSDSSQAASSRSLTAAVVGATVGKWHAQGLADTPGVRLVGICDIDRALADTVGAELGVAAYYSVEELLLAEHPDLVVVATSESRHVEPVIAALESGAHVLCEKIMADSLDGGLRIMAAAEAASTRFAVSYNYRQIENMKRLRDTVTSGALGEIALVVIEAHSWAWNHALDLARWIFGEFEEVVAAAGGVSRTPTPPRTTDDFFYWPDPAASAVLRTASGTLVTIAATLHASIDDLFLRFGVFGTQGNVELSGITVEDINGRVTRGRLDGQDPVEPFSMGDSLHASVRAFASAIVAGDAPPTSGRDGWEALRIEAAIRTAARTGAAVRVSDIAAS